MKLNKKFLKKFISCFGPTSSKRGSSSMNAAAHPTHPSTIEEEENHDSLISCAEGDLYCPAVNYDTKRVAGKKKKLNSSNTISSTSSDHPHHHQQHYWRPSLSVISEDKTNMATSVQSSVHRRSSSSPPEKVLAGKKHGACRRQRSTDSNEYHPIHQDNRPFEPMMPAFSPVAFMF